MVLKRRHIPKSERVTQSNDLARAAQDLSLNQKRFLLYTISRVKRTDASLLRHRLYVDELTKVFGDARKDIYTVVEETATSLLESVLHIDTEKGWKRFQWLSLAEYVSGKNSEGAYVEIKLHDELEPYLIDLSERFNSIPLEELLYIPSFNSLRVFELLWHDSHAGKQTVVEYKIEDLKVRMGLRDVDGKWEKYTVFKDFRRLIERAVQDIQEHTSIRISFTPVRKGRKLANLRFVVRRELPPTTNAISTVDVTSAETARLQKVVQELEEIGFTQNTYVTITTYGLEAVERVIAKAKAAERNARNTTQPVQNLGGLINWMLNAGLGDAPAEPIDDPNAPKRLTPEEIKRHAEILRDEFLTAQHTYLQEQWEAFTEDQKNEVHDVMNTQLDQITRKLLERTGWRGLLYESARARILTTGGFITLPEHFTDLRAYLRQNPPADIPAEYAESIVRYAEELLA